jgi:carbon-monoxide dehydrogenase medium subunit
MLDRFAIHRPDTVAEASRLLAHFVPDAAVYAGGTELLVVMKERLAHFPHLIDIKTISGLADISYDADRRELVIGAIATHRAVERSPLVRERFPVLAALESAVANVRVREAGTLGGNLCFADPHSDPAPLLVAYDARLTLAAADGWRELPLASVITGFMETARRHDELLTAIHVPEAAANTGVAYERVKLHERPTAAVAAVITVEEGAIAEARVVAGSVGARPQRLAQTEAFLRGQPPSDATAAAAGEIIQREVEPIAGGFESEAYTRQLARVTGRKAIAAAIDRATGEEGGRRAA